MRWGLPVTVEEAQEVLASNTGIITGGGYTFAKGLYCAQGVLPQCLRGGAEPTLKDLNVDFWYKLNLREFICDKGFYPSLMYMSYLLRLQRDMKDYSVNFDEMMSAIVNRELVPAAIKLSDSPDAFDKLLKDETHSKIYWVRYFDSKIPMVGKFMYASNWAMDINVTNVSELRIAILNAALMDQYVAESDAKAIRDAKIQLNSTVGSETRFAVIVNMKKVGFIELEGEFKIPDDMRSYGTRTGSDPKRALKFK